MATTITLKTGPLTSTFTAQDDTKAQDILRLFAASREAPAGATNQQLLDYVLARLVEHIVEGARQQKRDEAARAARGESETIAL